MEYKPSLESGPTRLPMVRINGVRYVLDGHMMQLRSVANPDDCVDFEPDEIEPWRLD